MRKFAELRAEDSKNRGTSRGNHKLPRDYLRNLLAVRQEDGCEQVFRPAMGPWHNIDYLLILRCARRIEGPQNLTMKTGCCSGS